MIRTCLKVQGSPRRAYLRRLRRADETLKRMPVTELADIELRDDVLSAYHP